MESKKISLSDMYSAIEEVLATGRSFELPITGTSMNPLLKAGRDRVEIIKTDDFGIGDIIFYRRDNGQFVLHRIVGEDKDGFLLCGDNQEDIEHGIRKEQIIGVVVRINRKGKIIDRHNPSYIKKVNFWVKNIDRRHMALVLMRKLIR